MKSIHVDRCILLLGKPQMVSQYLGCPVLPLLEKHLVFCSLLGQVDETGRGFVDAVVRVKKNSQVESLEQQRRAGLIPDSECPEEGFRAALPCDDNVEFEFNEALRKGDGYVASHKEIQQLLYLKLLVISIKHKVLVITNEILKDALTYAKQHNAQGAIFYVSRTTKTEANIPDSMDNLGNKKHSNRC